MSRRSEQPHAPAGPEVTVAPTIQVEVRKRIAGFTLDVSFESAPERVALLGASGTGKTLTLRSIAGIVKPESGRIVVRGRTLFDSERGVNLPPHQRGIGYVPQGYALFPHMSVETNVAYGLRGRPRGEAESRVREVIQLAGLGGLESRLPRELSGGQKQRVALARALAGEPLALLLDEPFSAIDAPLRAQLREELAAMQRQTSTAMLVVTHDLSDAFSIGDWIVVVDGGGVLQQGSKEEVYYRPATRQVAQLVGIRNVLPATVLETDGGSIWVDWNGCRLLAHGPSDRFAAGDRVDLFVRSTQLMIRRSEDMAFGERANVIRGRIVDEAIVAETRRLFVRTTDSGGELQIDLPEYTYFRLGLLERREIEMSVRPEHIHLLPAERR